MGIIVGQINPRHIKSEDIGKSDPVQVLRREAETVQVEDYSQLELNQTLQSLNSK